MSKFEGGKPAVHSDMDPGVEKKIDQIRTDVQRGRQEQTRTPVVDEYDKREHLKDAVAGRHAKDDVWNHVMNYHGFTWLSPKQLTRKIGKEKYIPRLLEGTPNPNLYYERPHKVGQWRRDGHWMPMSFTMADLWIFFGIPQQFDAWIRQQETQARKARSALKG